TITGPAVKITANPGPGLMVQCPGAGSALSTPCSYDIVPATFKLVNGVYRSNPVTYTVKPSTMAPTATDWDLRFTSSQIANVPKVVHLRYADAVETAVGPNLVTLNPPNPPAGFWEGFVTIDTPTLQTLSVAVKA